MVNRPPPQQVRSASTAGAWFVDDKRFYQYSYASLKELEHVVQEVRSQWTKPLGASIKQAEAPPFLWELARKRDRLSDSVKVFSAMSVEAFLNFYGVVRLEQNYFDNHVEKLGPVPKLKRLFALCEGKALTDSEPIVIVLSRIAARRNRLVHPRTVEVASSAVSGIGDRIPEIAREAIADMDAFFVEFGRLDPDVQHHLPSPTDRSA